MRANKLRELLKANKPTLSTHIHTTWPSVVEAIGHTGLYDYVEFVGEYGPFDLHDLDNLARAGDIYNMSMQLKVDQEPRGFLAQRAIGSGFHSILFADCRSAADVQECACARNLRRGHPSVHVHGLWRHQRIDRMKRLASRLTWWHTLPHKSTPRSTPQKGEARHGPYWHRRAQEGTRKPRVQESLGLRLRAARRGARVGLELHCILAAVVSVPR
jgi:hypothetical protein